MISTGTNRGPKASSRRMGMGVALAAALLLTLARGADPAIAEEHQYVGALKCRTCHKKELIGEQYAVWLAGPHRRAYETLKGEASQAIAVERSMTVPPHEADECLGCHVTAHDVPPKLVATQLQPADGVQCESCHGPGRDYRKKRIMSDRELAMSKGLWDAKNDAAICTTCHNTSSPTHDPARYTLPDGTTVGFDFAQAKARIAHAIPRDVKGRFVELEKKLKEEQEPRGRSLFGGGN